MTDDTDIFNPNKMGGDTLSPPSSNHDADGYVVSPKIKRVDNPNLKPIEGFKVLNFQKSKKPYLPTKSGMLYQIDKDRLDIEIIKAYLNMWDNQLKALKDLNEIDGVSYRELTLMDDEQYDTIRLILADLMECIENYYD